MQTYAVTVRLSYVPHPTHVFPGTTTKVIRELASAALLLSLPEDAHKIVPTSAIGAKLPELISVPRLMSNLSLPSSPSTVTVSIIDTTSWALRIPCQNLFLPRFKGLSTFDLCSYAFLVTHHDGQHQRRVLFDLGIRKDWKNLAEPMVKKLEGWEAKVKVEKNVADILSEHCLKLDGIEAIIWRLVYH